MENNCYIAIDLKSFYASVECAERDLDPLTTNLVVADESRTEKTICLAVSPSLKAYGIPGRARLFEVIQTVEKVNRARKASAPQKSFSGKSCSSTELLDHPELAVDFLIAPPRMAKYMEKSSQIYEIYTRYIAPEDIHVYSIDEVIMDVTGYLKTYKKTPRELAMMLIREILSQTGITATAGIGTNMYLCKVAMDIEAKHTKPDENGVRIAMLDEASYRRKLWTHRPITDFWRVGRGYARKLSEVGLYTMGDIARCSIGKPSDFHNEELLYSLFGINAELLIDHAWGYEPCTMADIKNYRPENNCFSSAQVLPCPYSYAEAGIVLREMADAAALQLVAHKMVTDQIVLTVNYYGGDLTYSGAVTTDFYGRKVPKPSHGTVNLDRHTASATMIRKKTLQLYEQICNRSLKIHHLSLTTNHVLPETDVVPTDEFLGQLDLFTDYEAQRLKKEKENEQIRKERRIQEAMLSLKGKYGKNALVKGTSLQKGATALDRNRQIGGHQA